jgi:hypothetical protein
MKHPPPHPASEPPHKWSSRRVAGTVVGLALAIGGVGLICGGAYAAIARSGGTYVDLGAHGSYGTDHYALRSDRTNWRAQMFGWAGSVRLELASQRSKPIFVGVAPAETVDRFLSGTGYTVIGDHTRTSHDGPAPTLSGAGALEWTAQTVGSGIQTLRWRATEHPQAVVAMNRDASRPVRVRIVSAAVTVDRMPWWVPTAGLAMGLVLLLAAFLMLYRLIRDRDVR